MARRLIFERSPDQVALFDELWEFCVHDLGGEPLGDVDGHAVRRLTSSYIVLALVRMLRELKRIHPNAKVKARGARVQDKMASGYTQAAHVLPCDINVEQTGLPGELPSGPLANLLSNAFNCTWVRLNVFGKTDRVHRLTNLADSYCEKAGLVAALINACATVAGDRPLDVVFWHELVPAYTNASRRALANLRADFSDLEQDEGRMLALRDHLGQPLLPPRVDLRRRAPNARARAANKLTLEQVMTIYIAAKPDRTALTDGLNKIEALKANEKTI